MKQKVDVVQKFIEFPEKRHKNFVPDLGEFLTLISLDIRYNWSHIKEAYLGECYSRNSLWIVRQHPELANTRDPSLDRVRPELSFKTNRVSLHLCLFHIYFLKMVARPPDLSGADVAARYDSRLGRPSRSLRNAWQASCRELMKVDSWDDYFRAIDAPVLSRDQLNTFLKKTIDDCPYILYKNNNNNNTKRR